MLRNKKIIAVVTGSRAEYGYLRPLIKEMIKDRNIKTRLYVCGVHLVKSYGYSVTDIIKDGFNITNKVEMTVKDSNNPYDLAISIAAGIEGFAKNFKDSRPDILVVFGDRIEPFAAAIAAASMDIPIAHISGGEVGLGDIDDNLRHAITKLAHLHFTSSRLSKERVLKLGEEPWRVFQVGALSLDTILNTKLISKNYFHKKYYFSDKPFILISYQPVTTEWRDARKQITMILESAMEITKKEKMTIIVLYPNPYPGGFQIMQAIKKFTRNNKNIIAFKNFPHLEFISLMSISSVLVGNSSSGIIEAPSLGVPYVCVGTRQKGREKGNNVIDVSYSKEKIKFD